ncbi:TadE/TadG family type IV pilus assembly protein [Bordetella sp. FB-8]|uniref:TadE/TadG family type IV pilus assembly protein n=1 Tax=Bordetella sp. FB-8 TaxID=1159870 RepID=UPI000477A668|nr:TadE family protein [Bordetella sp. FB-8]
MYRRSATSAQCGSALVESAVALGIVLFAGLAALEFAHWQLMRHLAQVALTEAARAGAAGHLRPGLMAQAFEAGMAPRYAAPDGGSRQRLRAAWKRTQARSGLPAWRLWVLQPDRAAYADFGQRGLLLPEDAREQRAIRNDYQAEQHAGYTARWPQGRGPRSGLTIFEANSLRLRLVYVVEPLVPALRPLLRTLAAGAADACARRILAAGALPLRLEMTMDMQSHALTWPADQGVSPAERTC